MSHRIVVPLIACAVVLTFAAGALFTTVSAQQGGTIVGHVKLTGTPPPNPRIQMSADPNCLKINAGKRVLQENVLRADDGGLANAFVNVQGSFPGSPAPTTSAVIDQQGCVYHPRVQGARVGQTLEVKNSDATLHNIHSLSMKKNDFNTGQPLAGMVFKYQLKAEEVMLHVKCDVHGWMTGYVGVVSHPYYAVSDATGAFKIDGVPVGKQTIQVWHEQYGPMTQTVEVKPGATATLDFVYTGTEKATTSAFHVEEVTIPEGASAIALLAPAR